MPTTSPPWHEEVPTARELHKNHSLISHEPSRKPKFKLSSSNSISIAIFLKSPASPPNFQNLTLPARIDTPRIPPPKHTPSRIPLARIQLRPKTPKKTKSERTHLRSNKHRLQHHTSRPSHETNHRFGRGASPESSLFTWDCETARPCWRREGPGPLPCTGDRNRPISPENIARQSRRRRPAPPLAYPLPIPFSQTTYQRDTLREREREISSGFSGPRCCFYPWGGKWQWGRTSDLGRELWLFGELRET